MSHRIRLFAVLPALIGVVLLLSAGWGLDAATPRAPALAAHASHVEMTVLTELPAGHHDTGNDAACALMCLAQRPVFAGPEGYRQMARVAGGPARSVEPAVRGRAPMPPWHPPEVA